MPRERKRRTDRGVPLPVLTLAADAVNNEGRTVRSVAKDFGICHTTLYRFIVKTEKLGPGEEVKAGYWTPRRVFSDEQEKSLAEYIKTAADLFYGLSTKEIRRFAYQLAVHYHCKYPETWDVNRIASYDWLSAFMKRQPLLSVQRPQPTSLSRATSFNRQNVSKFFDNLAKLLDEHKFHAKDVWNMDATGVTTVQNQENIVARHGNREVGSDTAAARGTLVTFACAVNALGNMIPPQFIFPRVHFKDHFIRDGPPGCIGIANASGWMLEEDFLVFLKHFQHYTKSSMDAKVLLILDNHSSHLSLRGIHFCRDNGIILLSFPPYCSHKLQPLDHSVRGPLKRFVNSFCDPWRRSHPGQKMSIYDIPSIVKSALLSGATPANVQSGFRCTGIWPFNQEVFQDADFAQSLVTDHPPTAAPSVPSMLPVPSTAPSEPSSIFPPEVKSRTTNSLRKREEKAEECNPDKTPEKPAP